MFREMNKQDFIDFWPTFSAVIRARDSLVMCKWLAEPAD